MTEKTKIPLNSIILLLSIFIGVALLIFTQSYFFGSYISPDSTWYLRAAEALRNGYGFHIDTEAGNTQSYFTTWPIGYPAMIAFIALITNTEIYLASKILSVIILSIIVLLFYFRFRKHAWMYALVLINYGFLRIFYYTWSEQPFILGLIWLSFALIDILESEKVKYVHYINITCASLFLFFSRYIGAFSVGVIGLTALYHLYTAIFRHKRENTKKAILLCISAVVTLTVMAFYLFNNYKNSGYAAGKRHLEENHLRVFIVLCKAQLIELQNVFYLFFDMSQRTACVLYAMGAVVCGRFLFLKRGSFYKNIPINALSFAAVGVLYWFSIVFLRFLSTFDDFNFRLLFPASALIFLGVIAAVCRRYSNRIEKAVNSVCGLLLTVFLLVSLGSYSMRPFFDSYYKHEPVQGYKQIRADLLQELSVVPPASVIISTNQLSWFMRPDLYTIPVYRLPITERSLAELSSSVEQAKGNLYLYVHRTLLQDDEKDSLDSLIAQYGNERTAQISERLTRLR